MALTVAHLLRSDAIEEFYDVIFDVLNNLAEDGACSNVAEAVVSKFHSTMLPCRFATLLH